MSSKKSYAADLPAGAYAGQVTEYKGGYVEIHARTQMGLAYVVVGRYALGETSTQLEAAYTRASSLGEMLQAGGMYRDIRMVTIGPRGRERLGVTWQSLRSPLPTITGTRTR